MAKARTSRSRKSHKSSKPKGMTRKERSLANKRAHSKRRQYEVRSHLASKPGHQKGKRLVRAHLATLPAKRRRAKKAAAKKSGPYYVFYGSGTSHHYRTGPYKTRSEATGALLHDASRYGNPRSDYKIQQSPHHSGR